MVKRVFSVSLALLLAFSLFSACASSPKTVMYVGDSAISFEEYNYTYNSQIQDFYHAYSSYLSYFGLDPDKPLEEQPCSFTEEGGTWADYFMDQTETILTQVYSFYNEARAKDVGLNEEYTEQLDAYMLSVSEAAKKQNVTVASYLADNFGAGVTEDLYREFLTHRLIATQYCEQVLAEIVYSDADYEAYYEKNKIAVDKVSFLIFTLDEDCLPAGSSFETEAELLNAIKALADSFLAAATSPEAFLQQAAYYAPAEYKENYSSMSSVYAKNVSSSDLSEGDMRDWLYHSSRKEGDKAHHQTAQGVITVCYFMSRSRDESPLASMRHILLEITETDEGSDKEQMYEDIVKIRDEWAAKGYTADAFAELAEKYTEDPGSASTGGVYTDFAKGSMVDPIDEWIFAEGRKEGDFEIILTEFGYHLVQFMGYGQVGWKAECYDEMQDEDYFEILTSLQEKYKTTFEENYRDLLKGKN